MTGDRRADPDHADPDHAGHGNARAEHAGPQHAGPTRVDPGPAAALHAELVARGETVAAAESLTGGLLCAALTETAGASASFRGGLVVYATDVKASLAGVPPPLLQAQGAVSASVAASLAGAARDRLEATYGVALTGVAGPEPQAGVPVGTVYVALATPRGGLVRRLMLTGDRAAIRAAAVRHALDLLAEWLSEHPMISEGDAVAPLR